jgi:hypothetical protein
MPCSFGLLPHPRSEPRAQLNDPLRVTVTVRWLPLVTAGDRCLWHAVGTTGEDDEDRRGSHGLQLQRRGRSVQGDTSLVGKRSEGARQHALWTRLQSTTGRFQGCEVAEDPQQVLRAAVSAANDVQKELSKVLDQLVKAQRHLKDERGHGRARQKLRQARTTARQLGSRLSKLESAIDRAKRAVPGQGWL